MLKGATGLNAVYTRTEFLFSNIETNEDYLSNIIFGKCTIAKPVGKK